MRSSGSTWRPRPVRPNLNPDTRRTSRRNRPLFRLIEARGDHAGEAARILEGAMRDGMLEVLPDLPALGLVEAKVGGTWGDKK